MFRDVLTCPLQQVDAIGIVVAGDELPLHPVFDILPAGFEQQVHGGTRHPVMQVAAAVSIATSGVVQMRQVKLVDVFITHQLQQIRQLGCIIPGQGKAQADLDPGVMAKPDTAYGLVKCPLFATKTVVGIAHTVEADADVVIADGFDIGDIVFSYQGAVTRQADVKPH